MTCDRLFQGIAQKKSSDDSGKEAEYQVNWVGSVSLLSWPLSFFPEDFTNLRR